MLLFFLQRRVLVDGLALRSMKKDVVEQMLKYTL